VVNYHIATVSLPRQRFGVVGDMELDEILYNRDFINTKLRDILDKSTDAWELKSKLWR
jgi:regulator of protease activity HflC (stomatin/prohibitin superfamily)